MIRRALAWWWDSLRPKVWAVTEDLGLLGYWQVSVHRSRSSATLSIPDGRGDYRVMHVDDVEKANVAYVDQFLHPVLLEGYPSEGDQ